MAPPRGSSKDLEAGTSKRADAAAPPPSSLDGLWQLVVDAEDSGSPRSASETSLFSDPTYVRYVALTTLGGAVLNVVLAAVKMLYGWTFRSHALVADGVHSLSDVVSDTVTIMVTWVTGWPPSASFPWGYGKTESLATLWVATLLLGGAGSLLVHLHLEFLALLEAPPTVHTGAVWVALASVVGKEAAFHVTYRVGKKLGSELLVANAWHHRSDALSSIAALAGVLGAIAGWPIADILAGVAVAVFMGKVGLEIGWGAVKRLADESCMGEVEPVVTQAQQRLHDGGLMDDRCAVFQERSRARKLGRKVVLELRLRVPRAMPAEEACRQGNTLSAEVRTLHPGISDVFVALDCV